MDRMHRPEASPTSPGGIRAGTCRASGRGTTPCVSNVPCARFVDGEPEIRRSVAFRTFRCWLRFPKRGVAPYEPYDVKVLFAVIGQLTTTSPSSSSIDINGGLVVVVVVIQLVFAALPAFIASRKGYSFALFFLFGFFCW